MAAWLVEFSTGAARDLERVDRRVRGRIIAKIEWLAAHFDAVVPLPLGGEFADFYKVRVGDWRVLYAVEWQRQCIIVHYVGRRDEVYKRQ